MTRRQWKKIAPGIWQTPTGFRVFVRVHQGKGGLKSKRFRSIAKLSAMKQWREDQRVTARHDPATKALAGGDYGDHKPTTNTPDFTPSSITRAAA